MKIPEQLYSVKSNLIFCLLAPIFVMLFVVIYDPTFGLSAEHYDFVNDNKGFCLPIICAIELLVLLVSRAILCFGVVRRRISELEFLAWQAVEFVVVCLFVDLFLSLYLHIDYFNLLPRILLVSFAINLFPYAFYWVFVERMDRDARIADAYALMTKMRSPGEHNEGMIRFVDDKGNTKLMVGAERVITIESAGNYITIQYDDDGKLMRYSLRNTLKSIEQVCNANGLVRCHRSFFVNLNKVKIIRRTPEGVVAEIDHPGVNNIPVSKTYAPDLIRLFSETV